MICKERVDTLMNQFRESQPDIHHAYTAAREIIDTGSQAQTPTPVDTLTREASGAAGVSPAETAVA